MKNFNLIMTVIIIAGCVFMISVCLAVYTILNQTC